MQTEIALNSDVRPLVDQLLAAAMARGASDVHVEPMAGGYELRLRIDGLLETEKQLDQNVGRTVVARLMVMAKLLTYKLDVPQEGRLTILQAGSHRTAELRLAIMPTIHGLRAAVRMPADQLQPAELKDLNLPANVLKSLGEFAASDAGMLIFTGPAGSGKTTSIYALLRQIVLTQPGTSIIALEDPVERDLPGVTQIEVSPFGQLTYERALRSILRQDPQVLMLGEIRDAVTASLAIQAALSGHRLITTLHAATPGGAIARLLEMGIEPYQITSSIYAVVSQRLARRKQPDGSYRGRIPLAELVRMDAPLRKAVTEHADAGSLEAIYRKQSAYRGFQAVADDLVERGITDRREIARSIGAIGLPIANGSPVAVESLAVESSGKDYPAGEHL